jgi:hypothetical protein
VELTNKAYGFIRASYLAVNPVDSLQFVIMDLIGRGSARIMANCNVKTLVSQTSYGA